ncbi:MAG: FMN-binding protein [Chitinispirillaceae bacterium]|nr:FMN-binding protein [Chitinispirillaceae bacterium]
MQKRTVVAVIASALFLHCPKVSDVPVPTMDFSNLTDGTFEGKSDCKKIVTATVEVTVNEGRVTKIDVIDHRHGPKYGGEAIVPRIIEKQSFQVDDVTGATISGRVIERAVADALGKSKKVREGQ